MARIKVLSIFEFEAPLDEILTMVRLLKGHLDKKSKKLVKDLLDEIDKMYRKTVDIVTPLYGATKNNSGFEKLFHNQYEDYKRII
jgi:hypothetical protein